jgi:hypothetical protein
MTETRRGHRGDFGDLILDELHEALKSKFPVLRAV